MKCHVCQAEFTPTKSEIASEMGKIPSKRRAAANKKNLQMRWPKGRSSKKLT